MEPVEAAAGGTSVKAEVNKVIGSIGAGYFEMFLNQMQSDINYTNQQVQESLNDS